MKITSMENMAFREPREQFEAQECSVFFYFTPFLLYPFVSFLSFKQPYFFWVNSGSFLSKISQTI